MAKSTVNEAEMSYKILDRLRKMTYEYSQMPIAKKTLNEAVNETTKDAIAITDDIKFGDHVLSNQINEFRSAVNGGAEFSKADPENPAESPLIYMPKNNNIVFSGTIPAMNNLEFQFVLKTTTGNGCFIWCDGLILSKENMKLLTRIQGYYENWKESWYQAARELESLKNME